MAENAVKVHDSEACGETFDDLAKDITKLIQEKKIKEVEKRLEKCKEARLNAAVHHGEMDTRHTPVYNLIDYLQTCILKINKTIKFAEVYGGKTTITFINKPHTFMLELSVKGGKRVYTIKAKGYDFIDTPI
jgi:hypothetical protein